jgi:hypothetical protein
MNKPISLIGLSGKMGSGKDLVARIIQYLTAKNPYDATKDFDNWDDHEWYFEEQSGWEIKKFAYAVKQICSILTGIPIKDFEKAEVKNSFLGKEWDYVEIVSRHTEYDEWKTKPYKLTVRELMQKVGTDAMRNVVHSDVWVNALLKDYKITELDLATGAKYPNWIISDCRFENEANAIKEMGGVVIRVNRRSLEVEKIQKAIKESGGYLANKHPSETSLDFYKFDYVLENSGTIEELIDKVRVMLQHFKLL